MIFVRFEQETPVRAKVTFRHNFPDQLTDEQLAEGLLVESMPDEVTQEGKLAVLYVNPQTKEFWYEFIDRPLTPDEEREKRIAQLEQQLKITQEAVDALLLG